MGYVFSATIKTCNKNVTLYKIRKAKKKKFLANVNFRHDCSLNIVAL